MTLPPIEVIAAVARNGVIGRGGTLPWHLPDDLRHFKALTLGHAILMGRKTYESIGKPLPGRTSIVVSTTLVAQPAPGVLVAKSLDDALLALPTPGSAFVIGGAALYAAAIPRAAILHLTEIQDDVEGDTYFPQFDRTRWRLVERVPHARDERHAMAFDLCRYERNES